MVGVKSSDKSFITLQTWRKIWHRRCQDARFECIIASAIFYIRLTERIFCPPWTQRPEGPIAHTAELVTESARNSAALRKNPSWCPASREIPGQPLRPPPPPQRAVPAPLPSAASESLGAAARSGPGDVVSQEREGTEEGIKEGTVKGGPI